MGNVTDLKKSISGQATEEYEPEFIQALKDKKYNVVSSKDGSSGAIHLYSGAVKISFSVVKGKMTIDLPRVNFEDPTESANFIGAFLKALDNSSGDLER